MNSTPIPAHIGHLVDPLTKAVDQCTRPQISILICLSFGEFVRTMIVSLSPDNWNSRTRFLPTSAAACAPSR